RVSGLSLLTLSCLTLLSLTPGTESECEEYCLTCPVEEDLASEKDINPFVKFKSLINKENLRQDGKRTITSDSKLTRLLEKSTEQTPRSSVTENQRNSLLGENDNFVDLEKFSSQTDNGMDSSVECFPFGPGELRKAKPHIIISATEEQVQPALRTERDAELKGALDLRWMIPQLKVVNSQRIQIPSGNTLPSEGEKSKTPPMFQCTEVGKPPSEPFAAHTTAPGPAVGERRKQPENRFAAPPEIHRPQSTEQTFGQYTCQEPILSQHPQPQLFH
ncbi:Nuclear receptor coactivator 7, partial [Galemys pyrenaicus]